MAPQLSIPVYIDGEPVTATKRRLSGRELRALVAPVANNLWLDVDDAMDRPIAVDLHVDVDEGMRFFTDRERTIYLDKVAYSVRGGVISEDELRALTSPPVAEDHGIWKDILDDLDDPIENDELVRISNGDRFFTRPLATREYHIIVNLRPRTVNGRRVTYDQIVAMAYPSGAPSDNVTFTVTYTRAAGAHPEGTLAADGSVLIKEGTIFNVRLTDKS